MYCQMDRTSLTVPKLKAVLRTMYKRKPDPRKCFIRRHAHHDSQIIHLLAAISARLKLKDSRARFVGTREEEKNQTKPTLEMVFFKHVKTLCEVWMPQTKGICVYFMGLAAMPV